MMEPGPVLAGFTGDAIDEGLAVLSDDELIGFLGAARRISSWAGGMELATVSHLDSRAAHARATGDPRQADHVADEVAVALTLTCRARGTGCCPWPPGSAGCPPSLRRWPPGGSTCRRPSCSPTSSPPSMTWPPPRSPPSPSPTPPHAIPFDQGGRTCECNLAAACQR